ncbi:26S protease regulatory subunit 6A [Hypsibius exemplaris]|uniref:26S protease regulatory subunit 6A n=1 Tax=Hypsibius exemplaris TaxID=2072580 RepID=A0A1W0X1F6_HYPEX|nr:26S protease regulatory subunit 6A [Hypsibius exemplaris]
MTTVEELMKDEILAELASDISGLGNDELRGRARLLDSEVKIMRSEVMRINHEVQSMKDRIKDNADKIKMNKVLPYLVSTVVEILDVDPKEIAEEEGANVDLDSVRKGKCAVVKTSTRQTFFLPVVGLVDAEELKPGDLVGVNKDSYLILEKLPAEYDARVKAMEVDERPTEQYTDIGGLDKQIQELVEAIVLPLTHKERFENLGIEPPKGVLLYGAPGTGKTLMARACAAQTKSTFLKLAGPQLVQMFIGDGAKLVRDAFALAKEKAPAIIFIDELDAIGTKRFDSDKSGDREVQRTMLELLNQMDGFTSFTDIKVIAATNRVDTLDPALMRSGRLDRKIEFPHPTEDARARIMQIHSRKMNVNPGVNYLEIARCTEDFNGAQCKAVCVEAGMIALRREAPQVNHEDFMDAVLETILVQQLAVTHTIKLDGEDFDFGTTTVRGHNGITKQCNDIINCWTLLHHPSNESRVIKRDAAPYRMDHTLGIQEKKPRKMALREYSHVVPFLMPQLDKPNSAAISQQHQPLQKHPWSSEPDFHHFRRSDSNNSSTSDEGVVADFPKALRTVVIPSAPAGSDIPDCDPNRLDSPVDEWDMRIGQNRLRSFVKWPASSCQSPTDMAEAGFFYTGRGDIVKCAFCRDFLGNWAPTDVPMEEHRRHYPRCPFVVSKSTSLSTPELSSSSSSPEDAEMAGEDVCGWYFPCRNPEPVLVPAIPKVPAMALYRDRFTTFSSWPRENSQRPRDLATAGLFFTGEDDVTACFHCGGTLHRWDAQDDPWTEHAKVYPGCEYVIASRGQAFVDSARGVRQVQSGGPESYMLVRASLTNSSQGSAGSSTGSQTSSGFEEESLSLPSSYDFSDRSMSDEDSEEEMIGQAVLRNSGLMDAIQQAVAENRQNLHFTRFQDEAHLIEAAKAIQSRKELRKEMLLKEAAETEAASVVPSDIESLTKEYERLKKERICKVCLVRDSQMIFHPCGHLVCCSQCSAEVQTCPVCRAVIVQKSRVYLA